MSLLGVGAMTTAPADVRALRALRALRDMTQISAPGTSTSSNTRISTGITSSSRFIPSLHDQH